MFDLQQINSQLVEFFKMPLVGILFFLWLLFWKGWALWKAASKRQLVWFIILLIVNTLGLLEALYVFWLNKWDLDKGRLLIFLEKKFKKS